MARPARTALQAGEHANGSSAHAIATAEQKIADLKAEIEAHRELSTSLAIDRASVRLPPRAHDS